MKTQYCGKQSTTKNASSQTQVQSIVSGEDSEPELSRTVEANRSRCKINKAIFLAALAMFEPGFYSLARVYVVENFHS